MLFLVGSYSEAEAALRAVLRDEPAFPLAHYWLGQDLAAQGRWEEALLEADGAAGMAPNRPSWLAGYALARMGRAEEALAVVGRLLETARVSYVPALDIASIYAGLDDPVEARRWLEKAIRERSRGLDHLGASPVFAPYHGEEWFAALIREPLRLPSAP